MKLHHYETSFLHLRGDEKITVCTLAVKGKIYQGIAKCSNGDNFCRETGRKIALTRAISKTRNVLDKEQRGRIWSSYRDLPKNPRW